MSSAQVVCRAWTERARTLPSAGARAGPVAGSATTAPGLLVAATLMCGVITRVVKGVRVVTVLTAHVTTPLPELVLSATLGAVLGGSSIVKLIGTLIMSSSSGGVMAAPSGRWTTARLAAAVLRLVQRAAVVAPHAFPASPSVGVSGSVSIASVLVAIVLRVQLSAVLGIIINATNTVVVDTNSMRIHVVRTPSGRVAAALPVRMVVNTNIAVSVRPVPRDSVVVRCALAVAPALSASRITLVGAVLLVSSNGARVSTVHVVVVVGVLDLVVDSVVIVSAVIIVAASGSVTSSYNRIALTFIRAVVAHPAWRAASFVVSPGAASFLSFVRGVVVGVPPPVPGSPHHRHVLVTRCGLVIVTARCPVVRPVLGIAPLSTLHVLPPVVARTRGRRGRRRCVVGGRSILSRPRPSLVVTVLHSGKVPSFIGAPVMHAGHVDVASVPRGSSSSSPILPSAIVRLQHTAKSSAQPVHHACNHPTTA